MARAASVCVVRSASASMAISLYRCGTPRIFVNEQPLGRSVGSGGKKRSGCQALRTRRPTDMAQWPTQMPRLDGPPGPPRKLEILFVLIQKLTCSQVGSAQSVSQRNTTKTQSHALPALFPRRFAASQRYSKRSSTRATCSSKCSSKPDMCRTCASSAVSAESSATRLTTCSRSTSHSSTRAARLRCRVRRSEIAKCASNEVTVVWRSSIPSSTGLLPTTGRSADKYPAIRRWRDSCTVVVH